jgi:hypothetical protein
MDRPSIGAKAAWSCRSVSTLQRLPHYRGKECRAYGAGDAFSWFFPALTGWANFWRTSGA